MPEIKFESEWLKANNNVEEGDLIRFLNAGEQDKDKNWVFLVGVIPAGTSRIVTQKKFSLNKRNFESIKAIHGSNSDEWVNKDMQVMVREVENPKTGELVDAIRLCAPGAAGELELGEIK